MAFQLTDDIQDLQQDALNERFVNMAAVMGLEATENMIQNEIAAYKQVLHELRIDFPDLLEIIDLISHAFLFFTPSKYAHLRATSIGRGFTQK